MAWHAKPSGSYNIDSVEAYDNMVMIWNLFKNTYHSTDEAIIGVLANCYAESGLNPWRWQTNEHGQDEVNFSMGYGLFQFTPAQASYYADGYIGNYTFGYNNFLLPAGEGYIDLRNPYYDGKGYSPNYSVSAVTSGATPNDGTTQVLALLYDQEYAIIAGAGRPIGLRKWNSKIWRTYWNPNIYPDTYTAVARIKQTYGKGSFLPWYDDIDSEDFQNITDIYDATLAFLGGYEGPGVPNTSVRYGYAAQIYEILTGNPPPPSPTPTPTDKKGMPLFMMMRYL